MKKGIFLAIICCVLPLVIVGFLLSRGQQPELSQSNQPTQTKTTEEATTGKLFPAFSVIDIDSKPLNNEAFNGKPTIIWFTTTWCTPCQVGAKKVAELNKELGGAFNVLVFFVDQRESDDDLRSWRNKYADTDWKLAFNNGLAEKIGIQFLDSKYLLDRGGVIVDFNTRIVDDRYLALLSLIVKESK